MLTRCLKLLCCKVAPFNALSDISAEQGLEYRYHWQQAAVASGISRIGSDQAALGLGGFVSQSRFI